MKFGVVSYLSVGGVGQMGYMDSMGMSITQYLCPLALLNLYTPPWLLFKLPLSAQRKQPF